MPLIKPRTRGKHLVRHITRLDRENNETLYAYAEFLGEPTEYVLNQLIESMLAKDKEFMRWRIEHPESFVPRRSGPSNHDTTSKLVRHRMKEASAPSERVSAASGV